MGCSLFVPKGTNVDLDRSQGFMQEQRGKGFDNCLLVGFKDNNNPSKVCLCGSGSADQALVAAVTQVLEQTVRPPSSGSAATAGFACELDRFDVSWDVAWRKTNMTSGPQMVTQDRKWFPIQKHVVALLDCLAKHGWSPLACMNFGGIFDTSPERGNEWLEYNWPVLLLDRSDPAYTNEHFVLCIKGDTFIQVFDTQPEKVVATGPQSTIEALTSSLTERLKEFAPEVHFGFDQYDTSEKCDAVWTNVSVVHGYDEQFTHPYFPRGKRLVAVLEEVYKCGWRLAACPVFGGDGNGWPCLTFKQQASPDGPPPSLLVVAIKDQRLPRKICLAGPEAQRVAAKLVDAFRNLPGQANVEIKQEEEHDSDWDAVIYGASLTSGENDDGDFVAPYFPRGDAIMTLLSSINSLGYGLAECLKFGGGQAPQMYIWPCMVFHQVPDRVSSSFAAIKDDVAPGRVLLSGIGDAVHALSAGFISLNGNKVKTIKDATDDSYDVCFQYTRVTTGGGSTVFSNQKPFWPFGYTLEMIVTVMQSRGWQVAGGPTFGNATNVWSCMVFQKTSSGKRTALQKLKTGTAMTAMITTKGATE